MRILLFCIAIIIGCQNAAAGTDSTRINIYDWVYQQTYRQLEKSFFQQKDNYTVALNFNGFNENAPPNNPTNCPQHPDGWVTQIKADENSECYFDKEKEEIEKTVFTQNHVGDVFETKIYANDSFDYEDFVERIEKLNNEYGSIKTTYFILVNYLPVEFFNELPEAGSINAVMTGRTSSGYNLSAAQQEIIEKAGKIMEGIVNKAIADLKAHYTTVTDDKKMFYTFQNYRLHSLYTAENAFYRSFFSLRYPLPDIMVNGARVSFRDIFNEKKDRFWIENNFVDNPFPYRKYISQIPDVLFEAFEAYRAIKDFASLAGNFTLINNLHACLRSYGASHPILVYDRNAQNIDACVNFDGLSYGTENTPDRQYGELFYKLENIPAIAFSNFPAWQKIKLLQILGGYTLRAQNSMPSTDLTNGHENTIVNILLSVSTPSEADSVINALKSVNEVYGKANAPLLIYDLFERVEDAKEQIMMGGDYCLSAFMNAVSKLLSLKTTINTDLQNLNIAAESSDPNTRAKKMVLWDYDYERLFRDYTKSPRVGTSSFKNIQFAENGTITCNKETITGFNLPDNELLKWLASPLYILTNNGAVTSSLPLTYSDPLELIKFVNRSNLALTVSPSEGADKDIDSAAVAVPALYLKYADRKQFADKIQTNFKAGMAIICIATLPFTGGSSASLLGNLIFVGDILTAASGTVQLVNIFTGDAVPIFTELEKSLNEVLPVFAFAAGTQILSGISRSTVKALKNMDPVKLEKAKQAAADYLLNMSSQETANEFKRILNNAPSAAKRNAMNALGQMRDELYHNFRLAFGENWMEGYMLKKGGNAASADFSTKLYSTPEVVLKRVQEGPVTRLQYRNVIGPENGPGDVLLAREASDEMLRVAAPSERLVAQVPDDATHITRVNHSRQGTNHISSTGKQTREDILLAQKADGKVYIVEGNLNAEGVCTNCTGGLTNCFTAATKIATPDGVKNIEDIQKNDLVWSYNPQTKKKEPGRVTLLFRKQANRLVRLITQARDTLWCTPEHPFYQAGQWVQAAMLKAGNTLRTSLAASAALVVAVTTVQDTAAAVYNFEVQQNHTYFVGRGQLLVHNNCSPIYDAVFNKLAEVNNPANYGAYFRQNVADRVSGLQTALEAKYGITDAATGLEDLKRAIERMPAAKVKQVFEDANLFAKIKNDLLNVGKDNFKIIGAAGTQGSLFGFITDARLPINATLADPLLQVNNFTTAELLSLRNATKALEKEFAEAAGNPHLAALFCVNKGTNGSRSIFFNTARFNKFKKIPALNSPSELTRIFKNIKLAEIDRYHASVISFVGKGGFATEVNSITKLTDAAGSEIAILENGILTPTRYDYGVDKLGAGAVEAGPRINGYQIYQEGSNFRVRRVPNESGFTQYELVALKSHPDAHTLERHGPDVTDEALIKRANTGFAPDGQNPGFKPPYSSKFENVQMLQKALKNTEPGTAAFASALSVNGRKTVSHTLVDGTNYGKGVPKDGNSFIQMNKVTVKYEEVTPGNWKIATMYPDI